MTHSRPERFLNVPPPRVRALPPGTLRGEGRIIDTPGLGQPYGIVSLDESGVAIRVPKDVIDAAHHCSAFKSQAFADVSYVTEDGRHTAVRINTVRRSRATA